MESFGNTRPDERSVAVVEWFRKADGKAYIRFDDDSRPFCFVNEGEAAAFEEAANAQGWQYKMVGYDDFTNRRTYHVTEMPKRELASIDPTKDMGIKSLNKTMRRRGKRIQTAGILPAVERLLRLSSEITIGQMSAKEADDTAEERARVERERDKGADRAVHIVRAAIQAEALNQADEHFDEKNERIDDGKPTDLHGVKAYRIDTETEGLV